MAYDATARKEKSEPQRPASEKRRRLWTALNDFIHSQGALMVVLRSVQLTCGAGVAAAQTRNSLGGISIKFAPDMPRLIILYAAK
jgi:hypothetical protein